MTGIIDGVRGVPWCVKGKDGLFYLMSFATLSTAVYKAFEKDCLNQNVRRTIRAGLLNAVLFSERMPEDVCRFLRDLHNRFHDGSSTSFMEVLNMIVGADADWKSHCIKPGPQLWNAAPLLATLCVGLSRICFLLNNGGPCHIAIRRSLNHWLLYISKVFGFGSVLGDQTTPRLSC
jgi:hypothetical protein